MKKKAASVSPQRAFFGVFSGILYVISSGFAPLRTAWRRGAVRLGLFVIFFVSSLFFQVSWNVFSASSLLLASEEDGEGDALMVSPDQAFLESLLKHGLYRLAELHCRERLSVGTIATASRAELTLELIRVLQERALCAPAPEKKELDSQALRLYEDFCASNPSCPWQLPVDFQYALGVFAHARRLEMEARFALNPEERLEEARQVLREAIRRFQEVEAQRETLVEALAQRGTSGNVPGTVSARKKKKSGTHGSQSVSNSAGSAGAEPSFSRFSGDGLSLYELESLRSQVQYQLLLAYELQARMYPEGSLDRLNALNEAQSKAVSLTMVPTRSSLYWKANLAKIRCFRLQNDFPNAWKQTEALEVQRETMPLAVQYELLAEKIRLALAAGEVDRALEITKTELHNGILGANGELDCAILELWLARWSAAMKTKSPDAQQLRDDSIGILETIRAKSAPWWVRQAEILFDGMLKNSGESQNLSFLRLAAENACANFDPDAPLACEKLWNAAREQGVEDVAILAAQMAAAVLYQNGQKNDASEWFRKIALTFPQGKDALKSHRQAIAVTAEETAETLNRLAEADSSELRTHLETQLDRYQTLLLEHFQLFGKTDSNVSETLEKLQRVTRIRGRYAECVDVSMLITASTPPESPSYMAAEAACFEVWRLYLTQLQQSRSPDFSKALFHAVRWCETLPDSEQRAIGSFYFLCSLDRLNAELSSPEPETAGDSPELSALQKRILQEESRLFVSLKPYLEAFPPEVREEIEQIGIRASLLRGKHEEIFEDYRKMAQKFPNRLEVQLTWGRLLAEAAFKKQTKELFSEALAQWRRVEKHVRDQSSEWYEAKYWILRSQLALGETAHAQRLYRTLKILHPDLGGTVWQKKFEALEPDLK